MCMLFKPVMISAELFSTSQKDVLFKREKKNLKSQETISFQQFDHGWLTIVGYKIGNSFSFERVTELSCTNVQLQCNEYLNLVALSLRKNAQH